MGLRAVPPPPHFVRRILHVIWPVVGVIVTALAAPVFVVGCFQALFTRRSSLMRATGLAVLLMWVDIRMLVACWRLWLASPGGTSPTWLADHERLFATSLDQAMDLARRWVGFEVVLDNPMWFGSPHVPLVAVARHAGPADSIALAWLMARTAGRLPRIVLAEALRWDPGIDTILTRLHGYFVPAGQGVDRIAGVAALAASLDKGDVLLVFPEGQNWSPKRRRHIITRFRERGELRAASRAEHLRHVLPPRQAGFAAIRAARPDADVMVVAHAGFGRLLGPREILDAVPFRDRPFLVHTWTYAAHNLPGEPADLAEWLDGRWVELDTWIDRYEPPTGGTDDTA